MSCIPLWDYENVTYALPLFKVQYLNLSCISAVTQFEKRLGSNFKIYGCRYREQKMLFLQIHKTANVSGT